VVAHLAQQKLRYEIVKNRLRNTQKRLYFDPAAGGSPHGSRVGFSKLFLLCLDQYIESNAKQKREKLKYSFQTNLPGHPMSVTQHFFKNE